MGITLESSTNGSIVSIAPLQGTFVDRSLMTSAVSQVLMPANPNRQSILIQTVNATSCWINFTTVATPGVPSIFIPGNSTFSMSGEWVSTEAINVIKGSGTSMINAKEG